MDAQLDAESLGILEDGLRKTMLSSSGPELDAALIAQGICDQLVRRVAFRRAMKRAIQTVQKAGAQGIKVQCSGRLGGSPPRRHPVHYTDVAGITDSNSTCELLATT